MRSLVPKASDTWLAIKVRRGASALPKPSLRASGVSTVASSAIFRRRSSSSALTMPSRSLTVATAAFGSAITSFMPLLKALRKRFTASGFFFRKSSPTMMALP